MRNTLTNCERLLCAGGVPAVDRRQKKHFGCGGGLEELDAWLAEGVAPSQMYQYLTPATARRMR